MSGKFESACCLLQDNESKTSGRRIKMKHFYRVSVSISGSIFTYVQAWT